VLLVAVAVVAAACSDARTSETATSTSLTTSSDATTTTVTTIAPSATTTSTTSIEATTTTVSVVAITPGEDPDVDAVILAYQIVFSSETGYEEKAPYLVDPTGLEETVAGYQETGESMGGVALAPTAVIINGDVAEVAYDLLFGGTPTYPDLSGDAIRVDDTWKVTREMFCAMMASARVGCPPA
jgi:hypothetical protein